MSMTVTVMRCQPIETAPKDRDILLYAEEWGWVQGCWFESPKQIDDGWETVLGASLTPTHWMEKPPSPE